MIGFKQFLLENFVIDEDVITDFTKDGYTFEQDLKGGESVYLLGVVRGRRGYFDGKADKFNSICDLAKRKHQIIQRKSYIVRKNGNLIGYASYKSISDYKRGDTRQLFFIDKGDAYFEPDNVTVDMLSLHKHKFIKQKTIEYDDSDGNHVIFVYNKENNNYSVKGYDIVINQTQAYNHKHRKLSLKRIINKDKRKKELESRSGNRFIESDTAFKNDYESVCKKLENVFRISEDGTKIEFPLIDESVDYNEDVEQRLEELMTDELFDDFSGPVIDESTDDTEETDDETELEKHIFNKNSQKKSYQKEISIAQSINQQICQFNDVGSTESNLRFYSCQKGGANQSDIIVCADHRTDNLFNNGSNKVENLEDVEYSHIRTDGKRDDGHPDHNDDFFYVEAKLDYDTASYFKFFMKYDFNGEDASMNNITRVRDNEDDLSEKLSKLLMKVWSKSKTLEDRFRQLNINIKQCINELSNIKSIQKRFKFKKIERLPDDFEEMGKVFNFYILEWTNKLAYLKSSYLYSEVSGKWGDKTQKKLVENQIKIIGKKIKTLAGSNDIEKIANMNFFQKFKKMYCTFISTDKSKIDGRNNQTLFDITIDGNDPTSSEFIDLIEYYYGTQKNAKYIEIGDDIYTLNSQVKQSVIGENPLSIKQAKPFSSLKGNSRVRAIIYVSTTNNNIRLSLHVFITKPDGIQSSGGFENVEINDKCSFIEHQLKEFGKGKYSGSLK